MRSASKAAPLSVAGGGAAAAAAAADARSRSSSSIAPTSKSWPESYAGEIAGDTPLLRRDADDADEADDSAPPLEDAVDAEAADDAAENEAPPADEDEEKVKAEGAGCVRTAAAARMSFASMSASARSKRASSCFTFCRFAAESGNTEWCSAIDAFLDRTAFPSSARLPSATATLIGDNAIATPTAAPGSASASASASTMWQLASALSQQQHREQQGRRSRRMTFRCE